MNVKSSNDYDEILYKLTGSTHRGLWWIIMTRLHWFLSKIKFRFIEGGSDEVIRFLHFDLKALQYESAYKRGSIPLRYLNKKGELMVGYFKVEEHYNRITLTETSKKPYAGKPTKGPGTFKPSQNDSSVLLLFGLIKRRRWTIYPMQIL